MEDLCDTAVVIVHFGDVTITRMLIHSLRAAYPNPVAPRLYLVENGPPYLPTLRESLSVSLVSLPKNRGYAGGANVGILRALHDGAEFLVLVNNDVEMIPGTLEAMRAAAVDPRVGLVGVILEESEGRTYGGGRVSWWRLIARLEHAPRTTDHLHYVHGACLGITRACASSTGLFRAEYVNYWEDVEYGLRARRRGWKFAVAPTTPLRHRSPSRSRARDDEKTYYLVRNAHYLVRDAGPWWTGVWARGALSSRRFIAALRGKPSVVQALSDARQWNTGRAPVIRS